MLTNSTGISAERPLKPPYVAYLLSVAGLVLDYGGDEAETIAALLDDSVEERCDHTSAPEITQRFGDRGAKIVLACSDTTKRPQPELLGFGFFAWSEEYQAASWPISLPRVDWRRAKSAAASRRPRSVRR
jgi:HD domain-containing protein